MDDKTESKKSYNGNKADEEIKFLLRAITDALENNPDCFEEYINEFGDYSIAIPLDGNKEKLEEYMLQQDLCQYLTELAGQLASEMRNEDNDKISCCFIGCDKEEVSWLATDDYRTQRLKTTLTMLIDGLSRNGVDHYVLGNTGTLNDIAFAVVEGSNSYLEFSKDWDGVFQDWEPVKIECIEVVSSMDEHVIDYADIVIALLDDQDWPEHGSKSQIIDYVSSLGKAVVIFDVDWFSNDWPDYNKIMASLPINQ